MMERIAQMSPRFKARMAGALYIFSLLTAIFGESVQGRLAYAAGYIAIAGMVALTLLLYGLFKPVNRSLSLLAAFLNLVGLAFEALRWTFLPRILGALMLLAGLGRLTYISPRLADFLSPYNLAAGLLGEVSVFLWFLVVGANVQRWKDQASAAGHRA